MSPFDVSIEGKQDLSALKKSVPRDMLGKPSPSILVLAACSDWATVLGCLFLFVSFDALWVQATSIVIASTRFQSFGVILHDVTHMRILNKTATIRVVEVMCGYPLGTTANAMRYHHIRHHRSTCMEEDPYFKKGVEEHAWMRIFYMFRTCFLFPVWHFRPLLGLVAFRVPKLRAVYARSFMGDKATPDDELETSSEVVTCCYEDRFQLLASIGLISVLVHFDLVGAYLLVLALAGFAAGHRLLAEHRYVNVRDRDVRTVLHVTREHSLSGIRRFLLAPRNIGHHRAHHLHPFVAYYHLPAITKWYRERIQDSL